MMMNAAYGGVNNHEYSKFGGGGGRPMTQGGKKYGQNDIYSGSQIYEDI